MIDRYLLRYFLAVLDHGNFSKAALACRISQPTLSVGIAKLEMLVDQVLFNRTNRRVEVTAAGARFALHARRIEAEFAEAERSVRDQPSIQLIRIGVVSTLPSRWIEAAILKARGGASHERLELVEGRRRDLMPMIERRRLDAVLAPLADEDHSEALFTESYAMALPVDHSLAGRDQIGAEEVAGETMIVRRHCEALPEISRFFTVRGIRPFMATRTTNDERAVAYVRAGLGITVMPQCFAQTGIAMPTLAGFAKTRTIGLALEPGSAERLADSEGFARFREAVLHAYRGLAVGEPASTITPNPTASFRA